MTASRFLALSCALLLAACGGGKKSTGPDGNGDGSVATPTFAPAAGTYTNHVGVILSCTTTGATIHYTTDGSTPTANSTAYTAPLALSLTTTVKARAYLADGTASSVATARYVIETGGGGGDETGGLEINAALGISLIAQPLASENAVGGLVVVELDGEDPPTGTTLTLNGTPLTEWFGTVGMYQVDPANLPTVSPGGQITLKATAGARSETLVLDCPATPNWTTAPAAGSALRSTSTVTANWTSNVYFNPDLAIVGLMQSDLSIRPYSSGSNTAYGYPSGAQKAIPVAPATSATVTAGDSDDEDSYLLQFDVVGPWVSVDNGDGGSSAGVCITTSRKIFTAQQ